MPPIRPDVSGTTAAIRLRAPVPAAMHLMQPQTFLHRAARAGPPALARHQSALAFRKCVSLQPAWLSSVILLPGSGIQHSAIAFGLIPIDDDRKVSLSIGQSAIENSKNKPLPLCPCGDRPPARRLRCGTPQDRRATRSQPTAGCRAPTLRWALRALPLRILFT